MFVDNIDFIYIPMHVYNLIAYNDYYSDTSGSLRQFTRDETKNNANVTAYDSSTFKCNLNPTDNVAAGETLKDVKIVLPLKYLSNFWRSLEIFLIKFNLN